MAFMSERSVPTQLSIAEVEKVAGAIRTLADVFELCVPVDQKLDPDQK